jgi:hypothetical protein
METDRDKDRTQAERVEICPFRLICTEEKNRIIDDHCEPELFGPGGLL